MDTTAGLGGVDVRSLVNTSAMRVGAAVLDRFTLPLVFDDRYFIVEHAGGHDRFTVFWFDGDNLVVDFLRNNPTESGPRCRADADGSLVNEDQAGARYRVFPGGEGVESAIQMTRFSAHRFPVDEGQLVVGGPMIITNRLVDGVPLGAHVFPDGRIDFHTELPDRVRAMLVPLHEPITNARLRSLERDLAGLGWQLIAIRPGDTAGVAATWELRREGRVGAVVLDFVGGDTAAARPAEDDVCRVRGRPDLMLALRPADQSHVSWVFELDRFARSLWEVGG